MEPPLQSRNALGYLKEAERNTAYYLFSNAERYLVQARGLDVRTEEEIKFYGSPISGDPIYDQHMANETVYRRLTIAEMAEFFKQGVTIGVCERKDTKRIYDRISDHLVAWREALRGINHPTAPIEDLLLLDQFANKVYEHAKWHFDSTETQSLLAQFMGSRFLRSSYLQKNFAAPKPTLDTPPDPRESMHDLFVASRQRKREQNVINGDGQAFERNPLDITDRTKEVAGRAWKGFRHGN